MTTAIELSKAQWALMDRMYNIDAKVSNEALAEYNRNIELASAAGLLDTMHCNEIDPDMFQLYSDIHKEEYGFRPRFHINRADADRFLHPFRMNTPS